MRFKEELLGVGEQDWQLPPTLHSCWNARGLYDPLTFVLRLRPDIHALLEDAHDARSSGRTVSAEQIQGFSTYFHETIHWWQHVGSTYGLLSSLLYPTEAHVTHRDLKRILELRGPVKSIKQLNAMQIGGRGELHDLTNKVLNNWHDLEFFRWLSLSPKRAREIVEDPYFESVGHSYEMALGHMLWMLSSTCDPQQKFIPDPRTWEQEFAKLRANKVVGYFHGSDVHLPPIGARELFEGQARFSQIQYLYRASGNSIDWHGLRSAGMLNGVYGEAFDVFLRLTGAPWPANPCSPEVGLFLAICDIAINPGEGFPFPILDYSMFVESVDPGYRFLDLCIAAKRRPELLQRVTAFSRDEYMEISTQLSDDLATFSPLNIAACIVKWTQEEIGLAKLLEEDRSFKFDKVNLPVRVFFGRFAAYQAAKLRRPEFFCWPGYWAVDTEEGRLDEFEALFEEHRALFVDRPDGDVYPRLFNDRREEDVQQVFDEFYAWSSTYDLTRQWLVGSGEFEFNFGWLSSKYSRQDMATWAQRNFAQAFGLSTQDFEILAAS